MAKPSVRSTAANGTGRARRPAAPRRGPWRANILLVDHDEDFSCRAAKALRAAGYSVFLAPDYRLPGDPGEPLAARSPDHRHCPDHRHFDAEQCQRLRLGADGADAAVEPEILYTTAYDFAGDEAIGKLLRKPLAMDRLVFEVGLALTTTDDSAGLGS